MKTLTVPVLVCAYRRPATTEKVFDSIRKARPKKLYVAVNAPQPGNNVEIENVDKVKNVFSTIDWECELFTLYREHHLSLKESIATAIDWFFDNEEEGIILEDDCLPSQSFFHYCQDLLHKYRDDQTVMHIGGSNHGVIDDESNESYFFSKHLHIWGWATWKRSWKIYDIEMSKWPDFKERVNFEKFFGSEIEKERKLLTWGNAYSNRTDCWDYQWCFSVLTQGGIGITPTKNLIKNIGIGKDATHTFNTESYQNFLDLEEMEFPLKHPDFKIVNYDLDFKYSFKNRIRKPTRLQQVKSRVKGILRRLRWNN